MSLARGAYRYEQDLVDSFLDSLRSEDSPWGSVQVGSEFFYSSGRTDVVAVGENGQVIAFEAKLSRWRDALHQAYRNTCFAHLSYVLLPLDAALRAVRYAEEFSRRRVGLCYLDGVDVVVLHAAQETEPLQPTLAEKAIAYTQSGAADAEGRS